MYRLLFFLHAFVGIGAVAGGLGAILNPQEPMGISIEMLKNSPFTSYLIPGIILFLVIGLGNIIAALMIRSRAQFALYISNIFTWALVIWIVVQCIMLASINILHIIYFIIALIGVSVSIRLMFKEQLYPTKFFSNF